MRSLCNYIIEKKEETKKDNAKKEVKKDKKQFSLSEFRKYFYAEEPVNVNDYWNVGIDVEVMSHDELKNKWVLFGDRKRDFNFMYLGKKGKTKQLRDDAEITLYTNGAYIQLKKKWVVIGEKEILNII